MSNTFVFAVEGIANLREFAYDREDIEMAALRAINSTLAETRTEAAARIRKEVNYSASYLAPSQKRLFVNKLARRGDLEGSIVARGRPTSLARFVQGSATTGQGVNVMVAPGVARYMKKAFLIKLRAGSEIETRFNRGLAIRLRPGETLRRKTNVVQMKNGLFILYGPSVSQVFLNNAGEGVAKELEPEVMQEMETEFLRQLELKGSGR